MSADDIDMRRSNIELDAAVFGVNPIVGAAVFHEITDCGPFVLQIDHWYVPRLRETNRLVDAELSGKSCVVIGRGMRNDHQGVAREPQVPRIGKRMSATTCQSRN